MAFINRDGKNTIMNICGFHDHRDGDSFAKNLLIRLWAHWCLKAVGTMGFMALFFAAYFYLLKNPFFSITPMPLSGVDHAVEFRPGFLYFYLSLWLYVSLVPALMENRRELIAYGVYIGMLCAAGVGVYIVFPTAVPPAGIDWSLHPDFAFLKTVDTAGNAFPSLHVATAFFTLFWLDRQLRQMRSPASLLLLNLVWCLGIVYSTMATKQHVFLDVAGGIVLGGFFAYVTLRHHRQRLALERAGL